MEFGLFDTKLVTANELMLWDVYDTKLTMGVSDYGAWNVQKYDSNFCYDKLNNYKYH